ncbi:hydroxymethylglutaryl-CoA lyase [Bacillus sp. FJAT-45350]|uniref:hydroxymethylglutaryl-CoA lyase n=1 Tax=Bacillus sp. FJAT-45350 TaxID=2011014 RepID=UPI0015C9C8EB|nr:hydroxymethylglutaryl-CoA lyase [Bacillus sp. FJAT-45350]
MIFPQEVEIRDVTIRDGFQNEEVFVRTDEKINSLTNLISAGFKRIEVTSFVHPKWVPTLQDADELAERIPMVEGVEYDALVPNSRGLDRFLKTKIHNAIFFLSASTHHNQANLNKSTDTSLEEVRTLIEKANGQGRKTIGGVATAFVCPYAGIVPYSELERVTERLVENGVDEIGLADTIGQATPKLVYEYCSRLVDRFPDMTLSLHLHDTYGYALANILVGLQAGVRIFDVAQGGLGGCPYAPGSPGNVQASSVVDFLEKQGINTGVNLDMLKKFDYDFPKLLANSERIKKEA